ncbi:MAG: thrombospondin type 3 repeat-containing protein [Deltaproteobacteria bacterium]|nr:thrombospondin type 3 repeat-containing protein [Deltaproteobacteria bacterium]
MPIPLIYLVGLGLTLAACANKKPEEKNECWEDTPEGRKPCKREAIPGPNPPMDTDGDGVPDDRDQCPNEAHIGSSDGCAPKIAVIDPENPSLFCDGDNDGDGIKNCEDQCPDIAGIAEAKGCTDLSYPLNKDYFHLVAEQSSAFQQIDTSRPCTHFYPLTNHTGTLLWSNGHSLKVRTTTQATDTVILSVSQLEPDIDLCPLRKAVAIDSRGRNVVLWQQGSAGELSTLFFQRFEANGTPIGDKITVDSFPMPNLGPRGDVKIASLAIKQNDDAVVAWVNRDKVMLREFPVTGADRPNQLVNVRSIYNPRSVNPDIALDSYGNMAVVWQEGTDETGKIGNAIYEANRTDPNSRFVGSISSQGENPSVAIAGGLIAYSWEEQGIRFQMQEKSATLYYVDKWSAPLTIEDSTTALHPSVVLDLSGRLTLSWLNVRADSNAYQLELKDFANYQWVAVQSPVSSLTIDGAVAAGWAPLISTRGLQSSLALFYPSPDTATWQIPFFDWMGSQSPVPGPALELEPTLITIGSGPAVLNWRNVGSELLTFTWSLSGGFFIQRDTARLSQGNETLESATGKANMMVSDGTSYTGNLTLRTNDPAHSVVTVTIQRGR